MFEAIHFLKFNKRFWNVNLEAEAIRFATSERSQKRLDELQAQFEFDSEGDL